VLARFAMRVACTMQNSLERWPSTKMQRSPAPISGLKIRKLTQTFDRSCTYFNPCPEVAMKLLVFKWRTTASSIILFFGFDAPARRLGSDLSLLGDCETFGFGLRWRLCNSGHITRWPSRTSVLPIHHTVACGVDVTFLRPYQRRFRAWFGVVNEFLTFIEIPLQPS
jgi:hypothetical protein